ncbi:YlmH family RNA-binding protein [Cohnella abietis]|uniref:Putative RNA-binding protein YlmH n=1 Tax=Cohnella abietis TaxID=2507935 RepID=A0A3T1D981_9BACL|nr:YlmH/Sll1252 family protein [Cohnella abietis]BBI34657.1 putative RNA-binding protein YlmH [Cohnella abietis]
MSHKEIYEHFHPDEKAFVDRAWEWVERAAERHETKRTDFLDPRQAHILFTLANRHPDAQVLLNGGSEKAERQRAIVAPDYKVLDDIDMGIVILDISSDDRRISELDHGDYLGALLGLGIKRDKIGDLHVSESGCHALIAEDIGNFLLGHMKQAHRIDVNVSVRPLADLREVKVELVEQVLSVASMRLDGVASDVFRLSRTKIVAPIKAGRCRVSWKPVEDPSFQLREGDMVSMKGFGRFKVLEVEGVSKSGRVRVRVGKFV